MVRKVTDQEAAIVREGQAQATLRKLRHRLAILPEPRPDSESYYSYRAFLEACMVDVRQAALVAATASAAQVA